MKVSLDGKGVLKTWLNERFCDGEIILDYPDGPNVITRILIKEVEGDLTTEEYKMLLALKMEEGAKNQGMQF